MKSNGFHYNYHCETSAVHQWIQYNISYVVCFVSYSTRTSHLTHNIPPTEPQTLPVIVVVFSQVQMLDISSRTQYSYLNTLMVGGKPLTKTHMHSSNRGQKPTVLVEGNAMQTRDRGWWHIRTPTGSDNCLPGCAKRGNAGVQGKAPVHQQHEPAHWHKSNGHSRCATLSLLY